MLTSFDMTVNFLNDWFSFRQNLTLSMFGRSQATTQLQ